MNQASDATQAPVGANLAADLGSNLDEGGGGLPPLVPPGAAASIEEQIAALTKQVTALVALQGGVLQVVAGRVPGAVSDETLQATAAAVPTPTTRADLPRVRIILEDNDAIPPGGQFASADGVPFLLQSGMEMDAPISLLDVLDHAITSVPVCDENRNVIGYRDRLRFPYRVVRNHLER